jgi:hypothetical protein
MMTRIDAHPRGSATTKVDRRPPRLFWIGGEIT